MTDLEERIVHLEQSLSALQRSFKPSAKFPTARSVALEPELELSPEDSLMLRSSYCRSDLLKVRSCLDDLPALPSFSSDSRLHVNSVLNSMNELNAELSAKLYFDAPVACDLMCSFGNARPDGGPEVAVVVDAAVQD